MQKAFELKKSMIFSGLGIFLGLGAPLGALLLTCWPKPGHPWIDLVQEEWRQNRFFYWYMLWSTCFVFGIFGYVIGKKTDLFLGQAITDPLTGLWNHRRMHDVFKDRFAQHLHSHKPISCLLLDLDRFKKVNDEHGHPFGDRVLKSFAGILWKSIREGDIATRYGGEEFLCILPDCDDKEARVVAERIRHHTERHTFTHQKSSVKITVSIGVVAVYHSVDQDYKKLIQMADKALYKAKQDGRNRVAFA